MIKKICKKLHMCDNTGSTMVEVLAGFTILVIVLVECSVHLLGLAGNMIKKAKDMQTDRLTLNEALYQKDADFVECTKKTGTYSVEQPTVTLTLDPNKTAKANIDTTNNTDLVVTLPMDATVEQFECDAAQLAIVHIVRKQ